MRSRLTLAALLATTPLAAQTKPFEFTIQNIMRGPELYGREPQRVRWSADGRWIYFQWNEPGTARTRNGRLGSRQLAPGSSHEK